MYGRELEPPLHLRGTLEGVDTTPQDYDYDQVETRRHVLREIYEMVKVNQLKASNMQANYYNKHHNTKINYQIGDLVLRRNFKLSSAPQKYAAKLAPVFVGPFKIYRKVTPTIYVIEDDDGRVRTYHIKDLKEFRCNWLILY